MNELEQEAEKFEAEYKKKKDAQENKMLEKLSEQKTKEFLRDNGDLKPLAKRWEDLKNNKFPVGIVTQIGDKYFIEVPKDVIERIGWIIYDLKNPRDPIRCYFNVNGKTARISKFHELL
jgi:hypothetical protein